MLRLRAAEATMARHHFGLTLRLNGALQLDPYVEAVQRQLAAAAEMGGDEARALAAQLAAALESTVRLTLREALASAVSEMTWELAPGSTWVCLRG